MFDRADSLAIGLDVGATKIAAALVAANGQVIATCNAKTRSHLGADTMIDQIAGLVNELVGHVVSDSHPQSTPILGIGIGIPGRINPHEGVVRNAVNLGLNEVYLVEELQARLVRDYPIWIETDTNASTLGEYYFGAAQGCPDFAYLSIGSGLGAGAMSNGVLLAGATWKATELGHMSLDPNGIPCVCGLRGCAETIVSGPGLLRLVKNSLEGADLTSRLSLAKGVTTAKVLSAALEGDELALAALSEMGCHLGIVISICASVLNPTMVVIGGGLGIAAFDLILPAAKGEIERRILPSLHSSLKITPSQQASSAIGAASLVLRHELEPV